MVSSVRNTANIQQDTYNNITQLATQNCINTVTQNTSGNSVFIIDSKVNGDVIGVSSTTSMDATCAITSSMDDQVQNILESLTTQSNIAETDWFNGFQLTFENNNLDLKQSITNNISQINQAMCTANLTSSTSNNFVYVSNSSFGGNFVGVSSVSNPSSNCNMSNFMKNITYNLTQGNADQSNVNKGMFTSIFTTLLIVVGVIIIGVVIIVSITGVTKLATNKKEPKAEASV